MRSLFLAVFMCVALRVAAFGQLPFALEQNQTAIPTRHESFTPLYRVTRANTTVGEALDEDMFYQIILEAIVLPKGVKQGWVSEIVEGRKGVLLTTEVSRSRRTEPYSIGPQVTSFSYRIEGDPKRIIPGPIEVYGPRYYDDTALRLEFFIRFSEARKEAPETKDPTGRILKSIAGLVPFVSRFEQIYNTVNPDGWSKLTNFVSKFITKDHVGRFITSFTPNRDVTSTVIPFRKGVLFVQSFAVNDVGRQEPIELTDYLDSSYMLYSQTGRVKERTGYFVLSIRHRSFEDALKDRLSNKDQEYKSLEESIENINRGRQIPLLPRVGLGDYERLLSQEIYFVIRDRFYARFAKSSGMEHRRQSVIQFLDQIRQYCDYDRYAFRFHKEEIKLAFTEVERWTGLGDRQKYGNESPDQLKNYIAAVSKRQDHLVFDEHERRFVSQYVDRVLLSRLADSLAGTAPGEVNRRYKTELINLVNVYTGAPDTFFSLFPDEKTALRKALRRVVSPVEIEPHDMVKWLSEREVYQETEREVSFLTHADLTARRLATSLKQAKGRDNIIQAFMAALRDADKTTAVFGDQIRRHVYELLLPRPPRFETAVEFEQWSKSKDFEVTPQAVQWSDVLLGLIRQAVEKLNTEDPTLDDSIGPVMDQVASSRVFPEQWSDLHYLLSNYTDLTERLYAIPLNKDTVLEVYRDWRRLTPLWQLETRHGRFVVPNSVAHEIRNARDRLRANWMPVLSETLTRLFRRLDCSRVTNANRMAMLRLVSDFTDILIAQSDERSCRDLVQSYNAWRRNRPVWREGRFVTQQR